MTVGVLKCCVLNFAKLIPFFNMLFSVQVYVEFDDQEWEKREWVKVYEDFQLFLLEHQLVWAKRKEGAGGMGAGGGAGGLLQATKAKHIQWPALVRVLFSIYRVDTVEDAVKCMTKLFVRLNLAHSVYHKLLDAADLNTKAPTLSSSPSATLRLPC